MKSVFEKISDREIPAEIIWEDQNFIAFLDINPKVKGHTLVAPKSNIGGDLFYLDDDKYVDLLSAAKVVSRKLKEKYNTERVAMYVEGFLINHVHIHLLPVNNANDLHLN
jgi:histidine triad (HIT) family protein